MLYDKKVQLKVKGKFYKNATKLATMFAFEN